MLVKDLRNIYLSCGYALLYIDGADFIENPHYKERLEDYLRYISVDTEDKEHKRKTLKLYYKVINDVVDYANKEYGEFLLIDKDKINMMKITINWK